MFAGNPSILLWLLEAVGAPEFRYLTHGGRLAVPGAKSVTMASNGAAPPSVEINNGHLVASNKYMGPPFPVNILNITGERVERVLWLGSKHAIEYFEGLRRAFVAFRQSGPTWAMQIVREHSVCMLLQPELRGVVEMLAHDWAPLASGSEAGVAGDIFGNSLTPISKITFHILRSDQMKFCDDSVAMQCVRYGISANVYGPNIEARNDIAAGALEHIFTYKEVSV